jgi:hypothetical protein
MVWSKVNEWESVSVMGCDLVRVLPVTVMVGSAVPDFESEPEIDIDCSNVSDGVGKVTDRVMSAVTVFGADSVPVSEPMEAEIDRDALLLSVPNETEAVGGSDAVAVMFFERERVSVGVGGRLCDLVRSSVSESVSDNVTGGVRFFVFVRLTICDKVRVPARSDVWPDRDSVKLGLPEYDSVGSRDGDGVSTKEAERVRLNVPPSCDVRRVTVIVSSRDGVPRDRDRVNDGVGGCDSEADTVSFAESDTDLSCVPVSVNGSDTENSVAV